MDDDECVYTWVPESPCARYGHCAVSLDDETMWVFGGRGTNGLYLNDTFLLNVPKTRGSGPPRGGLGDLGDDSAYSMNTTFRSERVDKKKDKVGKPSWTPGEQIECPRPTPRTMASAAVCGSCVAGFGGCDAVGCVGSLWLYSIVDRMWSELLVVGVPPKPRFGHSMLPLPAVKDDGSKTDAFRQRLPITKLLIFGGCDVSVVGAHGTRNRGAMTASGPFERSLGKAVEDLSHLYESEATLTKSDADFLRLEDHGSPSTSSSVMRASRHASRSSAIAAADAARHEARSRHAEAELVALLAEDQARTCWQSRTNRSMLVPLNNDAKILDLSTMEWVPVECGGSIIAPRMNFGAAVLGQQACFARHAIVLGGRTPSAIAPAEKFAASALS